MKKVDYHSLEAALLDDWIPTLASFATSAENISVYALAVQFHPYYLDPVLAVNTELGFDQIVARYPNESSFNLRRFGSARWNPAEFAHFDLARQSANTKSLLEEILASIENCSDREAAAHDQQLANVLVRVVGNLSALTTALDRTSDFVAYVWPVEGSDADTVELARRTIPPAFFDRLFPEVREAETFKAAVGQRSESERVAFWANALCDLIMETDTASSRKLRSLAITEYDATEALINVGPRAIPELLRIAEEHALAEEWNERDSEEWKRRGARTPRGDVASAALLALQDFDDASDEIISRLQTLLQRLHERDQSRALGGINPQLTARALHALRPSMFPSARFSDSTNHLLNFTDFFVQER